MFRRKFLQVLFGSLFLPAITKVEATEEIEHLTEIDEFYVDVDEELEFVNDDMLDSLSYVHTTTGTYYGDALGKYMAKNIDDHMLRILKDA